MVHREVVGLMNGELVMGGILEGALTTPCPYRAQDNTGDERQ